MQPRLGGATLSQLAFTGESNPNSPWAKSQWDTTVITNKKKDKKKKKDRQTEKERKKKRRKECKHMIT